MAHIFLFTHSFPYKKNTEAFLETEMKVISDNPEYNVRVIPLMKSEYKRDLPKNILLDNTLCNYSFGNRIYVFIRMLFTYHFWGVLKFETLFHPKVLFDWIKYFYGASLVKWYIINNKEIIHHEDIFYSYWFSFAPLGFALAKENMWFKPNRCFTRAHRFDIYGPEMNVFVPLPNLILKSINGVFSVSQHGVNYLKRRFPNFKDKIFLSRLGVLPLDSIPQSSKVGFFNIVSCSNVIPVKRVPLIFNSINSYCKSNPNIRINWTHIGDGVELNQLENNIQIYCQKNLTVNLLGSISNNDVRNLYRNRSFHLFVNLSESEGVPVSIMEALSASIPIIATDVGGNSEIVNSQSGVLLSKDFNQFDFNNALNTIIKDVNYYKISAFELYDSSYNANNNYSFFYKLISETSF